MNLIYNFEDQALKMNHHTQKIYHSNDGYKLIDFLHSVFKSYKSVEWMMHILNNNG